MADIVFIGHQIELEVPCNCCKSAFAYVLNIGKAINKRQNTAEQGITIARTQ